EKTRWRTRPVRRLRRMPAATNTAPPRSRGPGEPGRSGGSEYVESSDLPDLPGLPGPLDLVNVVVWRRLPERAAPALHQIALDEDLDVAVEHTVDVADLFLGAVVLHHLIGVQDVAADLTAEVDVFLDAADLVELRLVLFHLHVVEPRFQHAHRRVAVAVLRALVLTRDDQAGRQVRDADRRVGDVDVLPAGASRPERVDADVLVVDHAVRGLRQFRPDIEGRERGVAPRRRIERRNPHETVDADLGREQAVGILAGDGDRRALDARFLARLVVDDLAFE